MSSATDSRLSRNNFDLLRLVFAAIVCLVHVQQLSGFAALAPLGIWLSSDVAVKGFFVVSGFLIVMSYERSSSLAAYVDKRVRRIYPAYAVVVLACALGLVSVSSASVHEYFSGAWLKYVVANLAFLNFLAPNLPGVFEGQRLSAVNGALWTLKIEVLFYAAVPLLVATFRRFGRLRMLVLWYGLSVVYAAGCAWLAQRSASPLYLELGRQLPGQLSYFLAGAGFYYYLPWLEQLRWTLLGAAMAVLAIDQWQPLVVLEPVALATLVVSAGLFGYMGNVGRYGDFSYGVYITHFPVIQLLLHSGRFADAPWLLLVTTLLLTALASIVLWHGVEKHFLLRSSHYRNTETVHGR